MYRLFMTADTGGIFSPISRGLGFIFNAIYEFFSLIGKAITGSEAVNVGLVIVVFTIFIYTCLIPLTYKQQKFSFMSRKMGPELQAIQKKYANRRDTESMALAQEEQRAVYAKYGVSPSGSCIQLVIQLPILYALYGVFRNIPAYVSEIRSIFDNLVSAVLNQSDFILRMQDVFQKANISAVSIDFTQEGLTLPQIGNYVVDVAYKLNETGWQIFQDSFPLIKETIINTKLQLQEVNYIGILNISDTPMNSIQIGFSAGNWALVICALLIPACSFASQIFSMRTMNMSSSSAGQDQMARQMRMMNIMMPFISLIFVFNVPIGLGLYWISGAVYRGILQFFFNKRFLKIDMDEVIEKNKEKAEKLAKKRKEKIAKTASITAAASVSTKKTATDRARIQASKVGKDNAQNQAPSVQYKEGSLSNKANLVSNYNKKNNKK